MKSQSIKVTCDLRSQKTGVCHPTTKSIFCLNNNNNNNDNNDDNNGCCY